MSDRIMTMLADITGGKSYKAHKYGLDHAERPFIDYGEDSVIWMKTAETTPHRKYVSLDYERKKVAANGDQLLTYFLDGSRRVFKVDDIAYVSSGGRRVIYPVIAGQISFPTARFTMNRRLRAPRVRKCPGCFQPGHPAEDRGFLFYYFFKSKYIVSAYLIIDTQCFQVPNGQFVDAVFVSGIYLLCGSKH